MRFLVGIGRRHSQLFKGRKVGEKQKVNQKLEWVTFRILIFYGNELSKEKTIERTESKTEAEINKLEQQI